MPIDFAAGIILATSTMASVGDFTGTELSGLADVFEAEATDSPVPVLVVDDDTELCRWCESPDHTTDDHERLYPQPWGHDDPDDDDNDDGQADADVECDGDHGAPECADPGCWRREPAGTDDDDKTNEQGDNSDDEDQ